MNQSNSETVFDERIKTIMPLLEDYDNFDLVIGIPFGQENEKLPLILNSIDEELHTWIGRRQLIVCVGDSSSEHTLESITDLSLKHPHIEFVMPPEANGQGMSVRAIMEIAKALEADLLMLSTSMETDAGPGIDINWVESLLTPIQGNYDMVLGRLPRYFSIDSIACQFTLPILESFYGSRVSNSLGGIYAIAHDFIEELAGEAKFWTGTINGYGIDFWIITRALAWNKEICEVNLGGVSKDQDLELRNHIFQEVAQTVFESLRRDGAIWLKDRLLIKVADTLTRSGMDRPDLVKYPLADLMNHFAAGLSQFRPIIDQALPGEMIDELDHITGLEPNEFYLPDELWVSSIMGILLSYVFGEETQQLQCLQALTALFNGRLAGYSNQMESLRTLINSFPADEQTDIVNGKMEYMRRHLTEEFWKQKNQFNNMWLNRSEQVKPPLIPLGYMEYIPGKPVVVPKKIMGKDKRIVPVDNVFKHLRKQYEDKFNRFIVDGLGLEKNADPYMVTSAVENFMVQAETTLEGLLPGDLYTGEGIEEFVTALFALVPPQCIFTISSDILREMIMRFPPINLMVPLGFYKPADLLANMDVRDAVSYANLVETWSYGDRDLNWMADHLKPASFEWVDLKPLVISDNLPFGTTSHNRISNLNRVTARVTVRPLAAGKGGRFPRLLYFTSIIRRLGVAEQFSSLIQQNVHERKNIGLKTRNALLGLRQGDDFSASTIFENVHHRLLVANLENLALRFEKEGRSDIARIFRLMAYGYGLSQVLENGTFLTCTAWSWASYSFKGGLKLPGPLTTSVESRWFNHDFLEALYQELGYDQAEIMQTVFRMIHAGKGTLNLLDTLLPARPKDIPVVIQETTNEPSKNLRRFEGNPMLEPLADSDWECKYVLNSGALRIKDKVYLFYRAVGTMSRLI